MVTPASSVRRVRVGLFEIDLSSAEVRKNGHKVPLQEQPFRVLAMLLERPGEIVTREDLQARLWPADTYVGFDDGLNTAIRKLRVAFGDSADNPRFIETVPRRGYRVIAPFFETVGEVADIPAADLPEEVRNPVAEPPVAVAPRALVWKISGLAGLLLALLLVVRWLASSPSPRVVRINQLTHYGHVEPSGKLITDGARILFLKREGVRFSQMQMPVSGGESQPFPSPFADSRIEDIAPDRSEFLLQSPTLAWEKEFWIMPVVGGSPRRLSDLAGLDGAFSPDGQKIAYSRHDGIYVCSRNGSDSHKIVSLPGFAASLSWSPGGLALRFAVIDTKTVSASLWEVSLDGSNLHALLSDWNQGSSECCGVWSRDGRTFFFVSYKGEPFSKTMGNVWARRERSRFPFWSKPSAPIRLTNVPISFGDLRLSADGRQLFAEGNAYEQRELLRPSKDKKRFLPMLKPSDIQDASLSPQGDWLVVTLGDWSLWRSRLDGTERTQLTTQFPGIANKPRWSPDGTRIAFQGREPGRPSNIYVVSSEGGPSQAVLPGGPPRESPDWSPDGESILYVTPQFSEADPREDIGIFVVNLKTRKLTRLPGSEDMADARFLLDGRLVGFSTDLKKVMLFDFQGHDWKEIAHGKEFFHLERGADGKYLYFQDVLEDGEPLYRVHIGDWKLERVMSFESLIGTGAVRSRLAGMLQDGTPMMVAVRGGFEIYSLDLDLP